MMVGPGGPTTPSKVSIISRGSFLAREEKKVSLLEGWIYDSLQDSSTALVNLHLQP